MQKKRIKKIYLPNLNLVAAMVESSDPQQAAKLRAEYNNRVLEERMKLLVGLFEEFRISKDDPLRWPSLAYSLAVKHDLRFQVTHNRRGRRTKVRPPKKAVGRPCEWHPELLAPLDRVEEIRNDGSRGGKGMTRTKAIKEFSAEAVNKTGLLDPLNRDKPTKKRRSRIAKVLSRYRPLRRKK
jgi:hypothetical protein